VFGAILLGLLIANFGALVVFGPAPAMLQRQEILDPGEYERLGSRLASVERSEGRTDRGLAPAAPPLALIVGFSTAREDVDAALVAPSLCGGVRVLNLGGSGGSFRELSYYLENLRRTRLRPAVMILALHPSWLAGRQWSEPRAYDLPDLARALRGPERGEASIRDVARQWLWIRANRNAMHAALSNALLGGRGAVADLFGLSTSTLFPAAADDPWQTRRRYRAQHAPQAVLDGQLGSWSDLGWFSPDRYSTSSTEARTAGRVIQQASASSARTVVLLMPESSTLRTRLPAAAERSMRQVIAAVAPSVPVLDFRARIADSLFYDHAHLNGGGRAQFSGLLGPDLSRALRCP
jgi:hypothetical protein